MKTLHIEPLALPFLALVLVLLFGAAQYANNLGFFFAFWLTALAIGGLIGLRTRLDRVQVKLVQIDSGFANTPLHLQLELSGAQGLWLDMALVSADATFSSTTRDIRQPIQSLTLPQRPRGVHPAGNLRLSTRDHIGLLRATRTYPLTGKHWVYPAPQGERPLPDMARPNEAQGQDDFHGLRNYQAGDSPARIHWKSLAKSSPEHPVLRIKQFGSDTSAEPIPRVLDEALLLDLPLEARLSQLAAWILHCEHQQEPYALRLHSRPATQAGVGDAQRQLCLRLLAEAT
ncbi:MAG: DUF58 domain-containing protein [Halothiobacillaceae bacterium]|nr:DUF58 domain-containing protein [Halothiobacillaceae bacterium]